MISPMISSHTTYEALSPEDIDQNMHIAKQKARTIQSTQKATTWFAILGTPQ